MQGNEIGNGSCGKDFQACEKKSLKKIYPLIRSSLLWLLIHLGLGLCPTRWTVCAATLKSVIDNYEVLLEVWKESQRGHLDGEMKARIVEVETLMHTFDFLFGVFLVELILRHSDNLSKTLQQKTLSAAEGQQIARLTVEVLQSLRDSERVSAFYSRVVQEQICFGVSDPSLPRKRRAPQCFEDGSSASYFHPTAEDHYRQIYFEAVDHVIQTICNRLDQPGYGITRTGKHPS